MLSRTTHRAAALRSILHRHTALPFQITARLASSKPGETIGGTKTDHTKEFDEPSQSQKSGRQHTQKPGDTVAKGGSESQKSAAEASGRTQGSGEQESGQHVGPMGSG